MSEQESRSVPHDGDLSRMRNSEWLSSDDLLHGSRYLELLACIKGFTKETNAKFPQGRTANGYAMEFSKLAFLGISQLDEKEGKGLQKAASDLLDRRLFLNATNRRWLKDNLGNRTSDIVGQRIVVYVDPNVKLMGQKVPGLRLKQAPSKTA